MAAGVGWNPGVVADDGLVGAGDNGPDIGGATPGAKGDAGENGEKGDGGRTGEKGDGNISAGDNPPVIAADWAKRDWSIVGGISMGGNPERADCANKDERGDCGKPKGERGPGIGTKRNR